MIEDEKNEANLVGQMIADFAQKMGSKLRIELIQRAEIEATNGSRRATGIDALGGLDLHFTGSATDLSEVVIALARYVKKGSDPVTIIFLAEVLGKLFHKNLANISQLDHKLRNKKSHDRFLYTLLAEAGMRDNQLDDDLRDRRPRG